MKKAIVFDFDGVIADSFDIAFAVNQLQRPSLTREDYAAKFNGNIGDAKYKDEPVKEIDFFKEFGERFEKLDLRSEVKEGIEHLAKEYQLFISSSTVTDIIEKFLYRHGILDHFEKVLGWDIEQSKVKKFKMIFDEYGYSPDDIIFLTDTSGDIEEANEAGISFCIGILGGYQNRESLEKANPQNIVENFDGFISLLEENA